MSGISWLGVEEAKEAGCLGIDVDQPDIADRRYLSMGLQSGSGSAWYLKAGAGGEDGVVNKAALLPLLRGQTSKFP